MTGRLETRADRLARLKAGAFDLLVAGGGIVGAGIARDAAMRGLKVAIVDERDIAFGTSSRSSRLLHGGLRYLAQGRIGLVREASVEKQVVQRIAPNVACPLPFVFPTYKTEPWPLWKLSVGVRIYDLLCGGRNFGRSGSFGPARTLALAPGLRAEGLTGSVRYFDGLTNDARLVTDTLRSAANAGAVVMNYCGLVGAERVSEAWRCRLSDGVSGTDLEVEARGVANAAGPWAPLLSPEVTLRCTKGVHLVVDAARLPVKEAVVMAEGPRILFVIPWGERVIVGTTDTDYEGPLDDIRVDEADESYILGVTNACFPDVKLTAADIRGAWAGVRPLVADPNGNPSDISRSHKITSPQPGWWDVTGGKLTTYRLMAEQTVDRVFKFLARPRAACRTAEVTLLDASETQFSGILPPPVSREAVQHFCRREWALHLDDVMIRRSSWHYYQSDPASVAADAVRWMAEELGWDEDTAAREMERYNAAAGIRQKDTGVYA